MSRLCGLITSISKTHWSIEPVRQSIGPWSGPIHARFVRFSFVAKISLYLPYTTHSPHCLSWPKGHGTCWSVVCTMRCSIEHIYCSNCICHRIFPFMKLRFLRSLNELLVDDLCKLKSQFFLSGIDNCTR